MNTAITGYSPGQSQQSQADAFARSTTAIAAVPAALGSLDAACARLHDRLSLLEQRLVAVLQPLPPSPVGDNAKMARHSLALQIEAGGHSVNGAAERSTASSTAWRSEPWGKAPLWITPRGIVCPTRRHVA